MKHSAMPGTEARTVPREGIEREERLPAKERRLCIRRAQGREPYGWDETAVGAAGDEASVEMYGVGGTLGAMLIDSICRIAVYVIRTHGGVGGRGREVPSYPDYSSPTH